MTSDAAWHAEGRLSPGRLAAALDAICQASGLDASAARLIKFTNSAVFDLPRCGAVIKVAGSALVAQRMAKVITVAHWLEAYGTPAARLLPGVDQPIHAGAHSATAWVRVDPSGPAPTGGDLADLLLQFHRLPDPGGLPAWQPTTAIRARIADAEVLGTEDLQWLERCCDDLDADLAALTYSLPPGPIHGDAFLGNLIPGPEGPVLCDFDNTSIGPREWDLTPAAVGRLRFDYRVDAHTPLVARYGFDVTDWPGFGVLRRVRELQVVTSVLPVLASNPPIQAQFQHRLASFRAGDNATWQPYEDAFS